MTPNNSFTVNNAGLVILNSYLPMLFDRLGTTTNRQFVSPAHQSRSVACLQYLVTGDTVTAAEPLPLNNILCGLSPATGVTVTQVTQQEKETMEGLIRAAIGYWAAIGDSTPGGFRGNWMVRQGMISGYDDKWQLSVEKRSYDVLLHQSPFSFSIIKYPWMGKPLVVVWSY